MYTSYLIKKRGKPLSLLLVSAFLLQPEVPPPALVRGFEMQVRRLCETCTGEEQLCKGNRKDGYKLGNHSHPVDRSKELAVCCLCLLLYPACLCAIQTCSNFCSSRRPCSSDGGALC